MAKNIINPFTWGFREQRKCITIPTQRNATYTKPNEGNRVWSKVGAFFSQEMPPTPQLKNVCGIECPDC